MCIYAVPAFDSDGKGKGTWMEGRGGGEEAVQSKADNTTWAPPTGSTLRRPDPTDLEETTERCKQCELFDV